MKRILFVDDEQRVLSGLRRQLHARRAAWEMQFVDGGVPALAELARASAAGTPVDVVVSDMRMPGMDGAQLLARVSREFPHAGRIVLSGHADPDRMQLARSCAHRYLQKPCPPEALEAEVQRALDVREVLDRLAWNAADAVWCGPPNRFEHCASVFSALASEADTDDVVSSLLASFTRDGVFWARLVQLLSAAFPTLIRPGHDPAATIAALGTRNVLAVVMSLRFADAFGSGVALDGVAPAAPAIAVPESAETGVQWRHTLLLAHHAAAIVACEKLGLEIAAQTVSAALLALAPPAVPGRPADRALVMDYLLPTWGFRDAVVAAAAHREAPADCPAAVSGPLSMLVGAELVAAFSDPACAPDAAWMESRLAWLRERGWKEPRQRWGAAVAATTAAGAGSHAPAND